MLPYSWWILGIGTKIFLVGHFPTRSIFFILGHSCSFLFMMVSLVFSILPNYSEVFDWLSKLILNDPRSLLWFCFTSPCDWSVWFIQPIKCKTKPILTWSQAFSRASSRLPAFTLSFYWLMVMCIFALICSCDYFGFVLWHLIENCLSFLEVIYNLKPSLPNFNFFPSLYSFSSLAEY